MRPQKAKSAAPSRIPSQAITANVTGQLALKALFAQRERTNGIQGTGCGVNRRMLDPDERLLHQMPE